ncbi:MAG: hypothetical protein F4089_11840 [Gammaproteobacteria bacterium]|nr:hypothetical protein [Gammaproteobacteria bacterium]
MLGTWWLSSEYGDDDGPAELRMPGEFNPANTDAFTLTVAGSLLNDDDSSLEEVHYSHPAIHGKTVDAKAISLLNVRRVQSRTTFSRSDDLTGPAEERWLCNLHSEGILHIEPTSILQKVALDFDVTTAWANAFRDNAHGDFSVVDSESQTFRAPEPWQRSTSIDGVTVSLMRGWTWSYDFSTSFQASQAASFELEGSISVNELRRRWIAPLQGLMSFISVRPARLGSITGYVQVDGEPDGVGVDIHLSEPKFITEYDEAPGPLDLLATRQQLEKAGLSVDELIKAWFDLYFSARLPLVYLLSADLPHIYSETRAHFACMALEAFHNQFMDTKRWPPDFHAALVDKILNGLDGVDLAAEEIEWVKQRLRDGNNKGQIRKIREVFEYAASTSNAIQYVWPGFDQLVRSQRNKSAHPQESSGNDGSVSAWATKTGLQWILRHAYLRQLGIESESISTLMDKCYVYQRDLRHLQDVYLSHGS